MSPALATAILILLAGAVFMLPLLPAIVELRLKRDAKPLNVIQQYGGDIRHFAHGFRTYTAGLQPLLLECVASRTTATGTLPDGDEYLLLGRADNAFFLPVGKKEATCPLVVAAGTDVTLPDGMTFLKEVYAAGQFTGGQNNTYRAILGDKDIHLQRASKVIRWAHAAGKFQAEHDCDLYGRISSDQKIELQAGCAFQRLNAPRIVMTYPETTEQGLERAPELHAHPASTPSTARLLFENDLEIPPGEVITGSVVTRGKLRIGTGARVLGSVKSNKEMFVEAGVSVEGSLIGATTIHVGPDCRIGGPLIAEHGVVIESGTECGDMLTPTTVSAPTIELEEGVLVFGTVWARNEGRVVPKA